MLNKDKIRIAVLVSGGGTNLQALIDAEKSGKISSGEVVLVISNKRDAYALTRAKENGIETAYIPRKKGDSGLEKFEQSLTELLLEKEIELIVYAGFLCILSERFTSRWPQRMINIHPSLIPSFCGAGYYGLHVHEEVLKYGVKVTGATVHYVNEIPDGGNIIAQKAVYVNPEDTPETLQKRVMEEAEWILLPEATEEVSKKLLKERV